MVSSNGSETHAENLHVTSSGKLVKEFYIACYWHRFKDFMFLGFFRVQTPTFVIDRKFLIL